MTSRGRPKRRPTKGRVRVYEGLDGLELIIGVTWIARNLVGFPALLESRQRQRVTGFSGLEGLRVRANRFAHKREVPRLGHN